MEQFLQQPLSKTFYRKPTEEVARRMLGKLLVHKSAQGITAGRIVETEAYLFHNDPACHACRGMTARNQAMFGEAGYAYVYLIYGIYYCFNVVTAPPGEGEAVLVRALEPVYGLELMAQRRKTQVKRQLTSGPGKLCQAMAIDKTLNEADLTAGPLFLADDGEEPGEIITTTRIGISVAEDLPLRFYVSGNPYVSRK
ncbi:DNA-3-methyladenine glycosylase [Dethiobacter alkaliphilus]|uniref:DNA-3-methyladenine glycosylase n=1 Tax=Dethiobacter alkaliphilus TaxID=427926 RepID=UPI00222787C2|nr:DNA-3-methyladenine glycosylase [Dethiobacter alkaliphilus]MCW3491172.1 DNA-3-methyladenine glycosylase [Dethiobacter alkaliphilus]